MLARAKLALSSPRLGLDLVEKIVVVSFLGFLAMRMLPGALGSGSHLGLLLLLSESIVVLFVLARRGTEEISSRSRDWLIGFAGTLAPLLAMPASGEPLTRESLCWLIMAIGFATQLAAKFTLRRSFGVVAANRGVKIGGPYRYVRHPMYAGYALTHIAFLLAGPNLWNLSVYGATLVCFVVRIKAEERMLSRDPAYREFAAKVPYRLVPYVF